MLMICERRDRGISWVGENIIRFSTHTCDFSFFFLPAAAFCFFACFSSPATPPGPPPPLLPLPPLPLPPPPPPPSTTFFGAAAAAAALAPPPVDLLLPLSPLALSLSRSFPFSFLLPLTDFPDDVFFTLPEVAHDASNRLSGIDESELFVCRPGGFVIGGMI